MSPTTTPPPLISDDKILKRRSNDSINVALDESLSPLHPRRFTPTLHANLVSEILSLRRDLETKTKDIDRLEQSLHSSQIKNDTLSENLTASNKEVRSVRKQMLLLENGTLSAITDLSKERETALEEVVDLRRRLEQTQQKAKSYNDNVDRTQALWDKEKETWAVEKRALETKVHIMEGRLRLVLDELVQAQSVAIASPEHRRNRSQGRSSISGSPVKRPASGLQDRRNSAASIGSDHVGGRTSTLGFAPGAVTSLADELALDDIDEARSEDNDEHLDAEGRISPDALPEERGRPASSLSIKARKILGLPFDFEDMERAHPGGEASLGRDTMLKSILKKTNYVDAAVQYSRPGSPVDDMDRGTPLMIAQKPKLSVMVSTSCQTTPQPSPPASPRHIDAFLATIPESAWERLETKNISTQTDPPSSPQKKFQYIHSRTDTHDLGIPTIAIIPPGSRPETPQYALVLPPHTKNASCQVESRILSKYVSTIMQTEEIRIDRRVVLPTHFMSGVPISSVTQAAAVGGKVNSHIRKSEQPVSNSALKRSAPPVPPIPAYLSAPEARDTVHDQSSSLHPGNFLSDIDNHIEQNDEVEDDLFEDDDVFQRPTAKFTLKAGKMVSQDLTAKDIGELTAISAGEALALETLRQTEEALAPESRNQGDPAAFNKNLQRTTTLKRGQSSASKPSAGNMRRTALISSGAAAHHQHRHSQSTNGSSEGGIGAPPIPIPLRYSSARLGKSFTDGGRSSRGSSNTSPTRQGRRVVKPILRKARSGPALSPAATTARRQRSKSPPLDARISIVPDMPLFYMPDRDQLSTPVNLLNSPHEAVAPRPSIATGPGRQAQHSKTNSDAPLAHQNSVVDAIAQTMVGEWMYKYVRRRKSFGGKPDKDWDPNKSADELINNTANAGVRHKRWVWVAPYERAIMWSSKQPMNGTALMGKNGRKRKVMIEITDVLLTRIVEIKSVLDVKDENPMPKNSLSGPVFNRSILILTPQRALKFTATSQERHYVWLTALSFLSHSPVSVGDLTALPPLVDDFQTDVMSASLAGSLPKRRIRDSIRLAKSSSRQNIDAQTFIPDITIEPAEYYDSGAPAEHSFEDGNEAALPPVIRRFHMRKRSNTAPKAPPSAFRSFAPLKESNTSASASNYSQSVGTTDHGSSDRGPYTPSGGHPSIPSTRRGSEASALGKPNVHNFYNFGSNSSHNASMTMRMDAFIDNKQVGKGGYRNLRLASQGSKSNDRKKEIGYWGFDENGMSSLSPVDSTSGDTSLRYSESAGRGSGERDYFRNC